MRDCRIRDLGLIEYQDAYEIQKEYAAKVADGHPDTLLFCEHPTVLTLGRMTKKDSILWSSQELEKNNVQVLPIDRGGDVTLHAPGQLVVYSIFDLNYHGKNLHEYLRNLEQVGIALLDGFDIVANRHPEQTGVWIKHKKIMSIGIGVRKWVSYHGIGLNVNTDLDYFSMIRPCGLNVTMTSMAKIKGEPVSMDEVKEKLISVFSQIFELKII
ncbi:MAG: lipoyl(octanoyl) transferase LipB [Candidatus Omnitrophica bacterium]|nr:lipoyl(octanoyl) transferase LipB [Candidatus Omnitrophota bacterium]